MVSLLLRGIRALKVIVRIAGLARKLGRPAIDQMRASVRQYTGSKSPRNHDREKPARPSDRYSNRSRRG